MEIIPEKYTGPSKLDERLKQYIDLETGHVMLIPGEAKEVLFQTLLGLYQLQGVKQMDDKIISLLAIAGSSEVEAKQDYSQHLQSLREVRGKHTEEFERFRRDGLIFSGSRPPKQPEI